MITRKRRMHFLNDYLGNTTLIPFESGEEIYLVTTTERLLVTIEGVTDLGVIGRVQGRVCFFPWSNVLYLTAVSETPGG